MDEESNFNYALLKSYCCGEKIAARECSGKPFFFDPKFSLLFSDNHTALAGDSSDQLRRRMIPVEHHVQFKDKTDMEGRPESKFERVNDPNLKKKLLMPENAKFIVADLVLGAHDFLWGGVGMRPQIAHEMYNKFFFGKNDLASFIEKYFENTTQESRFILKSEFRTLVNLNIASLAKISDTRLAQDHMRPLGFKHKRNWVAAQGQENMINPSKN